MKKCMLMLAAAACFLLAGCGAGGQTETAGNAGASSGIVTEGAEQENRSESSGSPELVDLTALSSTMVYAEMYNITQDSESYVGKMLRVHGSAYTSFDEKTQNYYHHIVVADASACCAQGLEFVLPEGSAYPENGTEIEIEGIFRSYQEEDVIYYHIQADAVTVFAADQ